jgi:GAF domain-containing protein
MAGKQRQLYAEAKSRRMAGVRCRSGISCGEQMNDSTSHLNDAELTHAAAQAICACRDLEPLMATTRYWARRLTGADGVTFVLRAGESCYYADEDAIARLWKGQRFPLRTCVSGWVMQNRQPALIPDIFADPRVPHEAYRPTFVKSMLMVPVRKSDPIAAIGAYWKTTCAPTEAHVQIVELLAEAAAIGLASNYVSARVIEATAK